MKLYDLSFYDLVQWSIIVGALLFSMLYMLGRIAPQSRARLAQRLQQPRYARWVNRLGVRIGGAAGCGACDSCGTCAASSTANKK